MNMLSRTILAANCLSAAVAVAVQPGDVLQFAADGGLREVTLVHRTSPTTYIGSLDGYGDSLNATVAETADGWTMSIDDWRTRRMWRVVADANGLDVTIEDKALRPRNRCQTRRLRPSAAIAADADAPQKKLARTGGITAGWPFDPVTNEVDVLVVFDKTALSWLKSQRTTAKAFAQSQVDKMNIALANSGLANDFKMSLRGSFAADFDITRDCGRNRYEVLSTAIDLLEWGTGAAWRAIRAERERLGADVVVLLANSQPYAKTVAGMYGTVGISFGLEYESEKGRYGLNKEWVDLYREAAIAACDIRITEYDNTFGHEVGHVLGAGHSDLLSTSYSVPGPQLYPYSAALMYRDRVDREYYYTIMGYESTDGSWTSPTYTEIPYYSSPHLHHPATGSVLGDARHDNVRTLRETFAVVAQYRVRTDAADTEGKTDEPVIYDEWRTARTLRGAAFRALPSPHDVQGVFELKCGRANAKGVAKVSATLTGLDGKKTRYAARPVTATAETVTVSWGEGADAFTLTITGDSFTGGEGLPGGLSVRSVSVGGELTATAPHVVLETFDFAPGGELQKQLLPTGGGEPVVMKNGNRWAFAKAASVKLSKDKTKVEWDTSRNRTNLSGLKLTYVPKTGLFKGSFKIYALVDGTKDRKKLKKYTAKVSGVVVDGKGYGQATVTKPAGGPWTVTVGGAVMQ